jgi:branched-chain amino acid transport system permease protein
MIPLLIANLLALASLLIMMSSGLALIYGLRDVINFGHGALYMLGAYLGYSIARATDFWTALVVSPLLLAIVGAALEYLALRPLQGRSHIEVALVTLGLGIILGQILIYFYGGEARTVDAPIALAGSVTAFGLTYPVYRLFLIGMDLGSCTLLAVWLNFSTSGLHVRAVSQDPSAARMMGINADRLSLLVTSLSAAFAGVAGVLAGPYLSVDPGMDVTMIVIERHQCLISWIVVGCPRAAHDLSFGQNHEAVGRTPDETQMLLNHENPGSCATNLVERPDQAIHEHRRETLGWLIEKKEVGVGHQSAADREHLLLASA